MTCEKIIAIAAVVIIGPPLVVAVWAMAADMALMIWRQWKDEK
jgi:hypothetical protein